MKKPFGLSVKMLIKDKNRRFLLLKRSMNSKICAGKWDFPGGKVNSRESFDEALVREISEETGLEISIERLAGTIEFELAHVKVICLVMEGSLESGKVKLSSEHDEHVWIRPRELPKMDLCHHFRQFATEYSLNHSNPHSSDF